MWDVLKWLDLSSGGKDHLVSNQEYVYSGLVIS